MSAYIFSPSFCEAVDRAALASISALSPDLIEASRSVIAASIFFLAGFQLVAVFGQRLAGRVHQRVGLVARLGQFLHFLVFFGVELRRLSPSSGFPLRSGRSSP
jgi:hypothetical protein